MTTMAKSKLRHIAISVQDPEATAKFYEETFGLERVYKSAFGVMMTDGTMSLAVLKFPTDATAGDERGKDFVGLHHMGFVVDDIESSRKQIETNGGRYHMRVPSRPDSPSEEKFRDPNGIVFDIVTENYAGGTWYPKKEAAD
jgi:catechol 2,3-dioxygenase-like lactoylglutathione lyase family enzyme